jgi:lactate dehydrogenase-like 2-hydroxyacid dehydrogenase
MRDDEHIARQERQAEYASRRAARHAPGADWARTAYGGELRRLAAAVAGYGSVGGYVAARAAGPGGLAVGVYRDLHPADTADDAHRYWDAVFTGCGWRMDEPDAAAVFVAAALAVWADVDQAGHPNPFEGLDLAPGRAGAG